MIFYVMVVYVSGNQREQLSWQPLGYISSSVLEEYMYCDTVVGYNVLSSAYRLLCDTGKRDVQDGKQIYDQQDW